MTGARPSTLNLMPSPRILEMIAEVDLQLHQCLGELVDNALDELVEASAEDPTLEPRIDITLPTSSVVSKSSEISVGDNGRGMSPEQLQDALSAGTSGKQRFGSLGLFGMGFNIATARLGTMTEVRTGRRGDGQWVIAAIDLPAMQRQSTYEVPLRYEDKAREEHGTLVTVTNLREDMVTRLRSTRAIKETMGHLGRIYTYMLRDPQGGHSGAELMRGANQRLYVNKRPVSPHLPCIWDPSRSVTYKGGEVPAVADIDIRLTNAFACMNCGRWYTSAYERCVECESTDIEERERRIWGWLGIQRYADKSDFGLTFLRHGRAITYQDKSLFDWETPDGDFELEYPIELGMGRIVGEIHLDHAPVNVRKNNFDTSSQEWRFMVEKVRGPEPLRPQYAKRLVGHENTSPMSRFFNAYRENKPGLRYLVPGNGESSIHEAVKSWGVKFRNGDPEYLTDEKWYEAAANHDRIKNGPPPAPPLPDDDDGWLDEEGLPHLGKDDEDSGGASGEEHEADEPEPIKPETEEERFARYQAAATLLPDTDREVRIGNAQPVLRVYVTSGVELTRDGQKQPYAIRIVAGEVEIYVDRGTTLIAHYGWSPMNVALVCAAPQLKNVYSVDGPIDQLVTSILEQFPDRRVNSAAVRARADSLLDDMRERLADLVSKDSNTYWSTLSSESRRAAEVNAVSIAPDINWSGAVVSGEFARYLSAQGIHDLVTNSPRLVLDGALFRTTYASLGEDTRADQVARLGALLADLRRMAAGSPALQTLELGRLLLTADLLDAEIVSA
ncbi:ATP-binding protein [Actinophytocola glycyrrhizae]|uniref:ATP-binding protein n=1 Tax=Actinophytocola glycyrrhizae TaxID=2044873 RepID=A0ABV9SCX0_9PSEU